MADTPLTIDTRDLDRLHRALGEATDALRAERTGRLASATDHAADGLLSALRASAASSPTPQARIVASAMTVTRGEDTGVAVGGATPVGSRGTPAGVLLWGSERGGRNFDAAPGGAYWIAPAADAYQAPAEAVYLAACTALLRDAHLS